jgi:hypothetical protein
MTSGLEDVRRSLESLCSGMDQLIRRISASKSPAPPLDPHRLQQAQQILEEMLAGLSPADEQPAAQRVGTVNGDTASTAGTAYESRPARLVAGAFASATNGRPLLVEVARPEASLVMDREALSPTDAVATTFAAVRRLINGTVVAASGSSTRLLLDHPSTIEALEVIPAIGGDPILRVETSTKASLGPILELKAVNGAYSQEFAPALDPAEPMKLAAVGDNGAVPIPTGTSIDSNAARSIEAQIALDEAALAQTTAVVLASVQRVRTPSTIEPALEPEAPDTDHLVTESSPTGDEDSDTSADRNEASLGPSEHNYSIEATMAGVAAAVAATAAAAGRISEGRRARLPAPAEPIPSMLSAANVEKPAFEEATRSSGDWSMAAPGQSEASAGREHTLEIRIVPRPSGQVTAHAPSAWMERAMARPTVPVPIGHANQAEAEVEIKRAPSDVDLVLVNGHAVGQGALHSTPIRQFVRALRGKRD